MHPRAEEIEGWGDRRAGIRTEKNIELVQILCDSLDQEKSARNRNAIARAIALADSH